MNELALFAGIGGGILGTKWFCGFRTVCYVEKDEYCRYVLVQRIKEKLLDDAPIWDDARTFNGKPWSGVVDIITAGFPCQPFSITGKRRGKEDSRNMWPETRRIIGEVRPQYIYLENVPGLLVSGYYGTILGDLVEAGYDCRWCILGADDVGAPHRRKRLWVLAYPDISRLPGGRWLYENNFSDKKRGAWVHVSDRELPYGLTWWEHPKFSAESGFLGSHDVSPNRVDRVKAIGNSQVPLVAARAWRWLNQGITTQNGSRRYEQSDIPGTV